MNYADYDSHYFPYIIKNYSAINYSINLINGYLRLMKVLNCLCAFDFSNHSYFGYFPFTIIHYAIKVAKNSKKNCFNWEIFITKRHPFKHYQMDIMALKN